jgi:hypothetical protein
MENHSLFIVANQITRTDLAITKGQIKREWMDKTNNFAYRCLPLTIANQMGWNILNSQEFTVTWSGGAGMSDLAITIDGGQKPPSFYASSHFGHGILTISLPWLFSTDECSMLWIRGPVNTPKDGIQALEGIVETSSLQATATMNWKMTRPGSVSFLKDETLCCIVPYPVNYIENVSPSIRPIQADKDLYDGYMRWSNSRSKFNSDLKIPNSEACKQGWQKHYHQGVNVDGTPIANHSTKLNLKDFQQT